MSLDQFDHLLSLLLFVLRVFAITAMQTRNVIGGKPIIKGTRVSVELILELFAGGWEEEEILDNYPHLEPRDLAACRAYAAEVLKDERFRPSMDRVG